MVFPLRSLLTVGFVVVDHLPKVRGHRPVELVTADPQLAHHAGGIDKKHGWPRGVPGVVAEPDVHAVVSGHLAIGIGQDGKRNLLTRGKPRDGVIALGKDAGDGGTPSRPLVQLDLEPRQVALAAQSPGVSQEDEAEPPTGKVLQGDALIGTRHGNIEVRRAIASRECS